jgi:hypothetical protein
MVRRNAAEGGPLKPISLFVFLLMAGCAFGQDSVTLAVYAESNLQSFVVSGCPKDGSVIDGADRLEALARSGCTVWTLQEWADSEKSVQSMLAHGQLFPSGGGCPTCDMDVPALKIGEAKCATLKSDCGDSFCMPNSSYAPGTQICTEEKWTCEKGSGRILLEDVDGEHHCIKFPAH